MVKILDNLIEHNQADGGAGISTFRVPRLEIGRNVIRGNAAWDNGGAFQQASHAEGKVSLHDNLITGNSALYGGGLALTMVTDGGATELVNNTVADNTIRDPAGSGSELWTQGQLNRLSGSSNIFSSSTQAVAVMCNPYGSTVVPAFTHSLWHAAGGPLAGGLCDGLAAAPTNVAAPPGFAGPEAPVPYDLVAGSPALDIGQNASVRSRKDVVGRRRVADGDADGSATVDAGAYERPRGR